MESTPVAPRAPRHVELGMFYRPAERFVFPDLSVEVNLRRGALGVAADEREPRIEQIKELFPLLREWVRQPVGTFSGGQQRIPSVGRALTSDPKVLLFEQAVGHALRRTDRVYVMRSGRILFEESGVQMRAREHCRDLF